MPNNNLAVTIVARHDAKLLPREEDQKPLAENEITGKTIATLISAGTELAGNYTGLWGFPNVPGYSSVFSVESVGASVTAIKPGDLVFNMGPHQAYQRASRDECLLLPAGLDPKTALFTRMMSISMSTLVTTTARPAQKVVVSGLGPVGHLAAKIFASCGYEVTACDPNAARRELLAGAGMQIVAELAENDPDFAGHVALVVECSGHERAVLAGCRVVKKRGEVVLIGVPWERKTDIYANELLHAIFHKYAVVRSGWEWELPMHPTESRQGSIFDNLRTGLQWLASGRISVDGLYAIASPTDAQQVYQDLLHQKTEALVTLFDWSTC